jgi:hypothetical protein
MLSKIQSSKFMGCKQGRLFLFFFTFFRIQNKTRLVHNSFKKCQRIGFLLTIMLLLFNRFVRFALRAQSLQFKRVQEKMAKVVNFNFSHKTRSLLCAQFSCFERQINRFILGHNHMNR